MRPLTDEYRKIGPGTYQRFSPITGIRTTIYLETLPGGKRNMTIKQEQDVEHIIARNTFLQNNFSGYDKNLHQVASVPLVWDNEFKRLSGQVNGKGEYDEKKYKSLLNDRDYYRFKTVPGKI